MCSSTGLSAAAWIRTSASPGPRRGTGTSAGAGGRPAASTRAARTLEAHRIAGGHPAVSRHRLARLGVQARVAVRLVVALQRECAADRVVRLAGDHQVLGREAGDHLATVGRDHELLLDARGGPAVARRPERLEGEDHARLYLLGMVERDEPAEDRLLPDRKAYAVAELERERGLLVGEAELLRLRPALHELRAHVVEDLVHEADALVLAHARPHGPVELLVGGVHHHAGGVQQRDLVLGLD